MPSGLEERCPGLHPLRDVVAHLLLPTAEVAHLAGHRRAEGVERVRAFPALSSRGRPGRLVGVQHADRKEAVPELRGDEARAFLRGDHNLWFLFLLTMLVVPQVELATEPSTDVVEDAEPSLTEGDEALSTPG